MTFYVRWRVGLMTGDRVHLAEVAPTRKWETGRTLCGLQFSPGTDRVDRVRSAVERPFANECQHCAATAARREERDERNDRAA